jgi:signal transduction histidine kinase
MDERERSGGPAELWLPVSAELITGVHHALNNRVGALSAVAQVLEGDMDPHHPLREALAMEVERLQTTVRTLALLPRRVGAAPEPIHLPGLLPLIMELLSYHLGVRDTECRVEGDGEPGPIAQTLRPWADEVGGEVSAEGAGRFVLRLPTLGEVRRRER